MEIICSVLKILIRVLKVRLCMSNLLMILLRIFFIVRVFLWISN